MSKATCKTCGGTVPDGHVPSMLDPQGIGHPYHSVQASDTSLGNSSPPPADEQAAADELDRILRNLFIRVIMTQNSRELSDGLFETAKTSIAAYSRTQTEAVLSRLRLRRQILSDGDLSLTAVPLAAIDAEIARLRGEAGTQIIPTPSTSLSGTTEHLTEQNTKHSIRICREGKEIWKMPDTTTDGEMK